MSAKAGSAWMGSSYPGGVTEPRGPWHYDGEIDLGFGGALRMAATIVTRDPLFGWFAYGGTLSERGDTLRVVPRDGLRRRFDVVIPDPSLPFADGQRRLKIELERDGFAAGEPIVMDRGATRVAFVLENRTANAHRTRVRLALPAGVTYALSMNGQSIPISRTTSPDYPWTAELPIPAATGSIRVELRRQTP